jgi:proteasome lid subunit RPN8/RPN11
MRVDAFIDRLPEKAKRPAPPVILDLAPGLIDATQEALREESAGRREAICLWAGRARHNGSALISHLIVPVFDSTAYFLTIPSEERQLVSAFLRDEGLLLFADIHTHPQAAFLSDVDRERPFSVRDGFYAGVIPEFAQGKPGDGWRLYEVTAGLWHEVDMRSRING